jgi:predicted nucleic acid-binding protein
MTRVFLDANIFIYASGRLHPLQRPSVEILALAARHMATFFTDSEVLQEILHRFVKFWPAQRDRFFDFLELMAGRIEPLLADDVERAASLADRYPVLSARDLVHWAVMQRLGATRIVTADGNFGGLPGVERLDPMLVDEWRETVLSGS